MTEAEARGRDSPAGGERGSRPGPLARILFRLVSRLHRWAESGWGGPAVAGWGVLQGSVVPGPTDAVLVPLGISDPERVWRLALWATAGAVLGGLAAYGIGFVGGAPVALPLLEHLGVSERMLGRAAVALDRHGWLVVAVSTVSPLSAKVVCLASGVFGVPFWQFLPALLLGRAARFYLIATLIRFAGPGLLAILTRRAGVRPYSAAAPGQDRVGGVRLAAGGREDGGTG